MARFCGGIALVSSTFAAGFELARRAFGVLVITMVAITPVVTPVAALEGPASVEYAPTRADALVAAMRQGERVWVQDVQSSYLRVWANPDGTFTDESYSGPQFVQVAGGGWEPIDTTLGLTATGAVVARSPAADI